MTTIVPALTIRLRRPGDSLISLDQQFQELWHLVQDLSALSPLFSEWYLGGDSKEEALQYVAFDSSGPTTAAKALLTTEYKGTNDIRSIGVWNGLDGRQSASLTSMTNVLGTPDTVTLKWRIEPELNDWQQVASLMKKAVTIWSPMLIEFGPFWYAEHRVFKDRPGVGGLLYLPHKLTANQIPEARALVPVVEGKEQIGTIVVSVTDAAFDLDKPEHIAAANAIEVRLVDQDLLPLYSEL